MFLTPGSSVPTATSEVLLCIDPRAASSVTHRQLQFRAGDVVACRLPSMQLLSITGKILAIRPDPNGVDKLDQYVLELSPTVLCVSHADELLPLEHCPAAVALDLESFA